MQGVQAGPESVAAVECPERARAALLDVLYIVMSVISFSSSAASLMLVFFPWQGKLLLNHDVGSGTVDPGNRLHRSAEVRLGALQPIMPVAGLCKDPRLLGIQNVRLERSRAGCLTAQSQSLLSRGQSPSVCR